MPARGERPQVNQHRTRKAGPPQPKAPAPQPAPTILARTITPQPGASLDLLAYVTQAAPVQAPLSAPAPDPITAELRVIEVPAVDEVELTHLTHPVKTYDTTTPDLDPPHFDADEALEPMIHPAWHVVEPHETAESIRPRRRRTRQKHIRSRTAKRVIIQASLGIAVLVACVLGRGFLIYAAPGEDHSTSSEIDGAPGFANRDADPANSKSKFELAQASERGNATTIPPASIDPFTNVPRNDGTTTIPVPYLPSDIRSICGITQMLSTAMHGPIPPAETERRINAVMERLTTYSKAAPGSVRPDIESLHAVLTKLQGLFIQGGRSLEYPPLVEATTALVEGDPPFLGVPEAMNRIQLVETATCAPA